MSRKMKFGILGFALVCVALYAIMTVTAPGAATSPVCYYGTSHLCNPI